MSDQNPPITRIDMTETTRGVIVKKFTDGWTATTQVPQSVNTEKKLDEMVAWLKANGWTVLQWPEVPELGIPHGARAFKGEPMPVRTKYEILHRRSRLTQKLEPYLRPDPYTGETKKLPIDLYSIDLAYVT